MNRKQIALSLIMVVVLAVDAEAIYSHGLVGFIRTALATGPAIASFVDMAVALGLVCIWMAQDARERGVSALPYLLVTFALGSVGPLLYLISRFADQPESADSAILAGQPLRN
jgi:hypothetical protein